MLTTTRRVTGTASNGIGLHVRAQDVKKLSTLLVNTYELPTTPVREIIINALEVQPDGIPVKVTINTTSTHSDEYSILRDNKIVTGATITVEDQGAGMTRDFMETYLTGLMASTKENSSEAIGGFGIGAKSVMSISDFATWRSVRDGVETTLVMTQGSDGVETHITSASTDKKTGTSVTIVVSDGNTAQHIIKNINSDFLDYVSPSKVHFTVDGDNRTIGGMGTYDMEPGDVRIIDRDLLRGKRRPTDIIVLSDGNVPYWYPWSNEKHNIYDAVYSVVEKWGINRDMCSRLCRCAYNGVLVVRLSLPRNRFVPSREALVSSRAMDEDIIAALSSSLVKQMDDAAQLARQAATPQEWLRGVATFGELFGGNLCLGKNFRFAQIVDADGSNGTIANSYYRLIVRSSPQETFNNLLNYSTVVVATQNEDIFRRTGGHISNRYESTLHKKVLSEFFGRGFHNLVTFGSMPTSFVADKKVIFVNSHTARTLRAWLVVLTPRYIDKDYVANHNDVSVMQHALGITCMSLAYWRQERKDTARAEYRKSVRAQRNTRKNTSACTSHKDSGYTWYCADNDYKGEPVQRIVKFLQHTPKSSEGLACFSHEIIQDYSDVMSIMQRMKEPYLVTTKEESAVRAVFSRANAAAPHFYGRSTSAVSAHNIVARYVMSMTQSDEVHTLMQRGVRVALCAIRFYRDMCDANMEAATLGMTETIVQDLSRLCEDDNISTYVERHGIDGLSVASPATVPQIMSALRILGIIGQMETEIISLYLLTADNLPSTNVGDNIAQYMTILIDKARRIQNIIDE